MGIWEYLGLGFYGKDEGEKSFGLSACVCEVGDTSKGNEKKGNERKRKTVAALEGRQAAFWSELPEARTIHEASVTQ